jgi:AmiR/NasT family two-component response regulator
VQAATAYYSNRDLAEQLREAISSRAIIEQAKGVLMAQRQCTAAAAFELLVTASQRSNRKLREVAQALVDGTAAAGEDATAR